MLEAMPDNTTRTVSEIRAALGKAGGNLGENGCVAWMFEQKGLITVKKELKDEDELMELAIDAGADPGSVEIMDIEEIPLAYLPSNALRVKVKSVGNLDISKQN